MCASLQHFMNKFNEFKALPAGAPFSIKVTDREAEAAAKEYLSENKEQVKQMIRDAAGISLDVDAPSIRFGNDEIAVSARGGKGFLKVSASLTADVRWDGGLKVLVRSVDVPFISVSPEKLNSLVERPLEQAMGTVADYAEIRTFKLMNGMAVLEAVRK